MAPRELDVLRLLVDCRTDREVGESLLVHSRTASRQIGGILHKLDVRARSEAAVHAVRRGLR